MSTTKYVAAINSFAGLGKCSLNIILPAMTSCGINVCSMPTALLSSNGAFQNYSYKDLTDELLMFTNQWAQIGVNFSGIYTGFLGSPKQVDIVISSIEKLKNKTTIILVDPCMADNGKLYGMVKPNMPLEIRKLAHKADILTPNITEACMLLDRPFLSSYSKEDIDNLVISLSEKYSAKVVITGISFNEKELGIAFYERGYTTISYVFTKKIDKVFHGTGDLFNSLLFSALLNNKSLKTAIDFSIKYTYKCIENTYENHLDELSLESIITVKQ